MKEPHTADGITVLRKIVVAQRLGVSVWTLDRWVKSGQFPKPIYLTPGSPAVWRVRDIEAFLEKRKASRRIRPASRGQLKQNASA